MFSKKISFAVLTAISVTALAAAITIGEVNKTIEGVLAPHNNPTTKATISFSKLNIDTLKTLDFGVSALFEKIGSKNKLVLKLDNIDYAYGDGKNPKLKGAVKVDLDMVTYMGQEALNKLAKELKEDVLETLSDYTEKYGEALTIKDTSSYDKSEVDAEGNIVSFRKKIALEIDLKKLPSSTKVEKVDFKSLDISFKVDRKGISGHGEVILNPEHYSFNRESDGLKEYVEKLLNKDPQVYQMLAMGIEFLDGYAKHVVEKEFKAQK